MNKGRKDISQANINTLSSLHTQLLKSTRCYLANTIF